MFVARSRQCWRLAALSRRVSTATPAYEGLNKELRSVVTMQAAIPQPVSVGKSRLFFTHIRRITHRDRGSLGRFHP